MFLDLDNQGLLKSEFYYVCGVGWRRPHNISSGSCGCGLNIDAAVDHLIRNAQSSSTSSCAKYVRKALEAGGFSTDGRPNSACDYDTYLKKRFFNVISKDNIPSLWTYCNVQRTTAEMREVTVEVIKKDGKYYINDIQNEDSKYFL
ncbi:hypothetical protein AALK94_13030 [Bacteroides faecichinchillae]|uniref:hypothetical protein n=1 Tax=Bacteroides faecichinchillae TaxID=871325 RepID=UPI00351847CE